MAERLTAALLRMAMALVGVGVLIAALGLAYGSLESYPTGEQAGNRQIVWSFALAILLVVEACLALLLRRLDIRKG